MTTPSQDPIQRAVETERSRCVALVEARKSQETDPKIQKLLVSIANDIRIGNTVIEVKKIDPQL